jgi:hypothetical protein
VWFKLPLFNHNIFLPVPCVPVSASVLFTDLFIKSVTLSIQSILLKYVVHLCALASSVLLFTFIDTFDIFVCSGSSFFILSPFQALQ